MAPKVNDPQESWFKPNSQEASLSHPPETADPAILGPVNDSSSSDPPGAPTVEADLGQDAVLVTERDSAVSATRRPAVPQPASESGKATERPIVSYTPELEHYGSEEPSPYGPRENAPPSIASSQATDVGLNVPQPADELTLVEYRQQHRGSVYDAD